MQRNMLKGKIHGAAAHRIKKGEVVIIGTFAWLEGAEVKRHMPRVVFIDEQNRIKGSSRRSGHGESAARALPADGHG